MRRKLSKMNNCELSKNALNICAILEARRQEIINAITEQEKMTDELMVLLMKAVKLQELEDLYLPYRPKKTDTGHDWPVNETRAFSDSGF